MYVQSNQQSVDTSMPKLESNLTTNLILIPTPKPNCKNCKQVDRMNQWENLTFWTKKGCENAIDTVPVFFFVFNSPKKQTKTIRPEKAKTANLTTFSPTLTKTIRFSLFHTLPVIFNVIYGCSHFLDDASELVHDHFEHQWNKPYALAY